MRREQAIRVAISGGGYGASAWGLGSTGGTGAAWDEKLSGVVTGSRRVNARTVSFRARGASGCASAPAEVLGDPELVADLQHRDAGLRVRRVQDVRTMAGGGHQPVVQRSHGHVAAPGDVLGQA